METRYICDKCECNTMVRDAWVEWSGGEWVIKVVYEESFCTNCGTSTEGKFVYVDDDDDDMPWPDVDQESNHYGIP